MRKHYIIPRLEAVTFGSLTALCVSPGNPAGSGAIGGGNDPWHGGRSPEQTY